MKNILLFIVATSFIFAENNQTQLFKIKDKNISQYVDLGDLGSILEPILTMQSNHITNLITLFATFLTVIFTVASILGYFKSQSLIESIEKNKDKIENTKKVLEEEIKEEVSKQMVYQTKELITRIENYAYTEIKTKLDEITNKEQSKLFKYQKLLFQVNEAKKLEYEKVLKNSNNDKKLEKVIFIQNQFNEINNQTLPKLFSNNITDITTAAIKLSEYKILRRVMIKFLLDRLKEDKDKFTFAEKIQIKDILKEYYGVDVKDID